MYHLKKAETMYLKKLAVEKYDDMMYKDIWHLITKYLNLQGDL